MLLFSFHVEPPLSLLLYFVCVHIRNRMLVHHKKKFTKQNQPTPRSWSWFKYSSVNSSAFSNFWTNQPTNQPTNHPPRHYHIIIDPIHFHPATRPSFALSLFRSLSLFSLLSFSFLFHIVRSFVSTFMCSWSSA